MHVPITDSLSTWNYIVSYTKPKALKRKTSQLATADIKTLSLRPGFAEEKHECP